MLCYSNSSCQQVSHFFFFKLLQHYICTIVASLGSQAWNFFHSSFYLPDFGIFSPVVFKMGLQILYRNVCQLMSCCHTTRACKHSTGFHTSPLQETEGEREREREVLWCCFWGGEWGRDVLRLLRRDTVPRWGPCDLGHPPSSLAGAHGYPLDSQCNGFSSHKAHVWGTYLL